MGKRTYTVKSSVNASGGNFFKAASFAVNEQYLRPFVLALPKKVASLRNKHNKGSVSPKYSTKVG